MLFQCDWAKKLQFKIFTSEEQSSVVACVAMEDAENRVGNYNVLFSHIPDFFVMII